MGWLFSLLPHCHHFTPTREKEEWHLPRDVTYCLTCPTIDTLADSGFRICPLFTLQRKKEREGRFSSWQPFLSRDQEQQRSRGDCGTHAVAKTNTRNTQSCPSPPLNGIFQRLECLGSTPKEILHAVQCVHGGAYRERGGAHLSSRTSERAFLRRNLH